MNALFSRRTTLAIVFVVAVACSGAVRAADLIDRVLAVVAGTVITQTDVAAALTFGLVSAPGQDPLGGALEQLIRRELILGEVNRYSTTATDPSAIDKRLEEIRAKFSSPAAYTEALARTAMTEMRLRDILAANARIDEYMKQRFGVAEPTDEELADYYAAHRAEFTSGGRVLPLADVRTTVRQRVIDERRKTIVDDWVARLRRRAEVTNLYFGASAK